MPNLENLGLFLSPTDVEENTEITFINEGKILAKEETGFENDAFQIRVQLPNGQTREWTMNLTSQRMVGRKHGTDTALWIGKTVRLSKKRMMVSGKEKDVLFVKGD